jgi:hypothetical protein
LAPWEYTIAELLSDAGYATALFGAFVDPPVGHESQQQGGRRFRALDAEGCADAHFEPLCNLSGPPAVCAASGSVPIGAVELRFERDTPVERRMKGVNTGMDGAQKRSATSAPPGCR